MNGNRTLTEFFDLKDNTEVKDMKKLQSDFLCPKNPQSEFFRVLKKLRLK